MKHSIWIQTAWQSEMLEETNKFANEAVEVKNKVNKAIKFDENSIMMEAEVLDFGLKSILKNVKAEIKNEAKNK